MRRELLREAKSHLAGHQRRRMWRKVVGTLACVVVFCTTYALILPAITLEKTANCGKEEHVHTENCYAQAAPQEKAVPVCSPDSLGIHRHTDACRDENGEYTCGYSDFVVHQHNASCYDESGTLWCPLPERKAHTHSESCYAQPEAQTAHAHTDECYTAERGELTCAVPEGEGAHAHGEGCYDESGELVCQLAESAGHAHTDECYAWSQVLICQLPTEAPEEPAEPVLSCGKEEIILHTHTDECFDEDGNRICGQVQVLEHAHTQDCFQTAQAEEPAQTLICGLEEHTHTEACFPQETTGQEEVQSTVIEGEKVQGTVSEETQDPLADPKNQDGLANPGDVSVMNLPVEDTYLDGGDFGTNNAFHWKMTLNGANQHVLTISGAGPMGYYYSDETPWAEYNDKKRHLVFADDVTHVSGGAYANRYYRSITFGKNVEVIGEDAFSLARGDVTELTIPGNVKTIQSCAFNASSFHTFILEEGIESLGWRCFDNYKAGVITDYLLLPASLKSVSAPLAIRTRAYKVAEGDSLFFADAYGALYKWNDSSHATATLADYPRFGTAVTYTVPENVTVIADKALMMCSAREVIIPNTVQQMGREIFPNLTTVETVHIGEDVNITSIDGIFRNCSALTEVTLPKTLTALKGGMFENCSSLSRIAVNKEIKQIDNAFTGCTGLQEFYYNAQDCNQVKPNFPDEKPYFTLTIGRDVDYLRGENGNYPGFASIAAHAETVRFEGENWITVEDGAMANAPAPLNGLSGNFYVDEQGAVYRYDSAAGTAALVYVPGGVTEMTVPATIPLEGGGSCPVTGVETDALTWAENLESITFDAPQSFTRLDVYALANCSTLKSVNGETTVEGAEALFPQDALGYGVFHNTGLTGASGSGAFEAELSGQESLAVTGENVTDLGISVSSGGTMRWEEKEGGVGGYRLLTGDVMKITASVGNTEGKSGAVYRIYFQLTGPGGSLGIATGQTYTFDGQVVTCHPTEDPYAVYLEFRPEPGKTISIPVDALYPSPGTRGGGLTVWGNILTEEQANAFQNKRVPSESGTIQAYWTTEPDTFELRKTNSAPTNLGLASDGAGGVKPNGSLNWQIQVNRKNTETNKYGKDYVKSVDVTDRLTLPAGVTWKPEVLEAIQSGNIRASGNGLYAGNVRIANISPSGSGFTLGGRNITWDTENSQAVLRWSLRANSGSAEMNASTVNLNIYPEALTVDTGIILPDKKGTITNTAEGTVHFHYGQDQKLPAVTDTKTISGGSGTIGITQVGSNVTFFGEDQNYTIEVYNNGFLPWVGSNTGTYNLSDPLSVGLYIKPDNLQRMFDDADHGDRLTVTIQHASLGAWEQVTGVDGNPSWKTPWNSDMGTDGHTLVLTKPSVGAYQVSVDGGEPVTASSIQEALKQVGYGVTEPDTYTCTWALNGENETFTLEGGDRRQYFIYATAKSTFQLMPTDWPNQYYPDLYLNYGNQAKVLKPDGNSQVASSEVKSSIKREACIDDKVYRDGAPLDNPGLVASGEVLEYRLNFTHYGRGSYEDLPMVDDIYGSQYLLVPAADNPDLSDKGLETKTDNGTTYYILKEGTYRNVKVGVDDQGTLLTADSITVAMAEDETQVTVNSDNGNQTFTYSGLHTRIKWYFPTVESGDYRKVVTYHTLVDNQLTGVIITVGNLVWMNDRSATRLYASLWGGGTMIDFEKHIVTEPGETPALDKLDEDGYSLVGSGESVTYRLTLHNKGTGRYVLPGSKLADALPETWDKFQWEKGNENDTDVPGKITGFRVETTGSGLTYSGLEDWRLDENYPGILGDRQYIRWPDDASITFTQPSTVYLYFTLTYPVNTDEKATWTDYANALNGASIDNTLFVYRFPSAVRHDLKEEGQVVLQKGVDRLYYINGSSYYTTGESRLYYNNKDQKERMVCYYVTLYNGGNRRLYLNDLYDQLPKGFSFYRLQESNGRYYDRNYATTPSGPGADLPSLVNFGNENVTYRSARVTVEGIKGGLRFSFGNGSGDYTLHYDESRKKYYLGRGEAIAFRYVCKIGSAQETEDFATNVIAMPYTDPQETGLSVISKSSMPITAPEDTRLTDYNDGSRKVQSAGQVKADYGFESAGGEKAWLVSDVTVRRGSIIPGVTKYTESYTDASGETTAYTNSVGFNDTVNWRVRLHNSGSQSISDYTFTDILPKPYVFVGKIVQKGYSKFGWVVSNNTLLTFPSDRTGDESEIYVTYKEKKFKVVVDGPDTELDGDTSISLKKDANGNEVLSIRLKSANDTIYEGGHTDITLSAQNLSGQYENTVYTNRALFTPNQQPFSIVEQGSMVRDESGKPVSVENSAPATVSFGSATGSEKRVSQTDDPTNAAVSTDPEHSTILLPPAKSGITYTLTVDNATDSAMNKLVLIDNLPDVGDHSPFHVEVPRNSAFRVSLAENPGFTVTVTPQTGEPYTLASGDYSVEYSTGTDFGGPQSPDWKGETEGTTAAWTSDPTGARAFRVIIRDETGEKIPPKSRISLTFNARVEGEGSPGSVAWNSFGYHYALIGGSFELEAMPLAVGVRLPGIPTLEKQLVDGNGAAVTAAQDEAFAFLVYEGEALPPETGATEEALTAALTAANRKYHRFNVTVSSGSGASGRVYLNDPGWTWQDGGKYTVVELPGSEDYTFRSFSGSGSGSFTFTYRASANQEILCKNTFRQWKLSLTKVDMATRQPLSGAVFALYSPEEGDRLTEIPQEYQALAQETVTREHKTWYLAGIRETGADGALVWEDLLRETYYLLEVKAPDGYMSNSDPGQIVRWDDTKAGELALTVENRMGHELPKSGGAGTTGYTVGGLLAICAGCLLLYSNQKRRKEDTASS